MRVQPAASGGIAGAWEVADFMRSESSSERTRTPITTLVSGGSQSGSVPSAACMAGRKRSIDKLVRSFIRVPPMIRFRCPARIAIEG